MRGMACMSFAKSLRRGAESVRRLHARAMRLDAWMSSSLGDGRASPPVQADAARSPPRWCAACWLVLRRGDWMRVWLRARIPGAMLSWRVARGGWCRGGRVDGWRADWSAPGRRRRGTGCCRRRSRSTSALSRWRGRRCSSSRGRFDRARMLSLRSRADVEPCGVAIAQMLLTEPSSALYRPAYREELYELARAALFALGPREAAREPLRR